MLGDELFYKDLFVVPRSNTGLNNSLDFNCNDCQSILFCNENF